METPLKILKQMAKLSRTEERTLKQAQNILIDKYGAASPIINKLLNRDKDNNKKFIIVEVYKKIID
jgi:hypothetical protein